MGYVKVNKIAGRERPVIEEYQPYSELLLPNKVHIQYVARYLKHLRPKTKEPRENGDLISRTRQNIRELVKPERACRRNPDKTVRARDLNSCIC